MRYRALFFKPAPVSVEIIARNDAFRKSYWNDVANIHKAGEKIREGNEYFKIADYEAAAAYEQAYEFGDKPVGGFKLADTYEKLGQNDRAISLLENMIQKQQLSKLGIQDAKEMIDRLLTAKAQE